MKQRRDSGTSRLINSGDRQVTVEQTTGQVKNIGNLSWKGGTSL